MTATPPADIQPRKLRPLTQRTDRPPHHCREQHSLRKPSKVCSCRQVRAALGARGRHRAGEGEEEHPTTRLRAGNQNPERSHKAPGSGGRARREAKQKAVAAAAAAVGTWGDRAGEEEEARREQACHERGREGEGGVPPPGNWLGSRGTMLLPRTALKQATSSSVLTQAPGWRLRPRSSSG